MHKKNLLFIPVIILIMGAAAFLLNNTSKTTVVQKQVFAKASIAIADDPYGRIEFERKMLADPATGKIPENIRQKELKFASTLPKVENINLAKGKGINTLTWSKRGPINRGGRTRALAVDVRTNDLTHFNANTVIIIAGGASGGIYKSTDAGDTWVNKLSPDSIHSITCIAQDTRLGNEDTWYVGTGEAQGGSAGADGAPFRGDGIYKSTDNGETWTLLPSTSDGKVQTFSNQWRYINNIAVNKATGAVFAAAINGIQRSQNGGTSWVTNLSTISNNTMSDVQITSTGVIYATVPSGVDDAGISRSPDDGVTWTIITPTGFPTVYGRNVIAIAPSNEDVVYFWVYTNAGATGTQLWKYTYVSGDGSGSGGTWENFTANLPAPAGDVAGVDVQGSYNMLLKVKSDDPDFVVFGGTNLYRTTDGFSTAIPSNSGANSGTHWIGGYAIVNNITQYANHHPDQHSFVFGGSTITSMALSGSDGGISFSADVTVTNVIWEDANTGYVTSQFYAIDIDPNTVNDPVIAGGMQDNGNYITFSTDFNTDWVDWNHGGDGAFAAVRKTDADEYTIYIEAQRGWLFRHIYNSAGVLQNGFGDFIQPPYTGQFAFVNPFILDRNDNNIMYFAQGDSVLRSNDVGGGSGTPTWNVLTNATTGGSVSALAVTKSPANILFVGGSNGKILKITGANTGNPTATDISTGKGLPTGYVNCIAVDDAGVNMIVVFSNYSIKSIWSSDNGGTTWSDISGNLEENADGSGNGPSVRWISVSDFDPNNTIFYVATSTGLYSTSDIDGTSTVWAQEGSTTIGNVLSPMVKTRDSDGLVVVATHGAGIYSAKQTLVSVEDELGIPANYTLSQNYPNPFNPSTTIKFSLPQTGNVQLTLFDALGRKVKDIVNKEFSAGNHTINFNASSATGGLSSGVYFYRLQVYTPGRADNFVQTKKMILLR